jgi:hypothetical protein
MDQCQLREWGRAYDLIWARADFSDTCFHLAPSAVCMDLDACMLLIGLRSARLSPVMCLISSNAFLLAGREGAVHFAVLAV